MNYKQKGIFITFEGLDGSGKSTQAHLLRNYLVNRGFKVVFINNSGSRVSKRIMEILTDPTLKEICYETELLLFAAIRAQNVREIILPSLNKGIVVILNRYSDSMIAYQHYGRNIDIKIILWLNNFATSGLQPDLTFLLDIDPLIALKRIKGSRKEKDRIEQETLDFYSRVRNGYLKIAENNLNRIKVIDATKSITEIHSEIIEIFEKHFSHRLI